MVDIPRIIFFRNAEIEQKDHLWTDTNQYPRLTTFAKEGREKRTRNLPH